MKINYNKSEEVEEEWKTGDIITRTYEESTLTRIITCSKLQYPYGTVELADGVIDYDNFKTLAKLQKYYTNLGYRKSHTAVLQL